MWLFHPAFAHAAMSQLQVMERRAMRGLAAAARLQGQFKTSIKHLERVLEISKEMKEYTGGSVILIWRLCG